MDDSGGEDSCEHGGKLFWLGKCNEDVSLKEVPCVHLPFPMIETIN